MSEEKKNNKNKIFFIFVLTFIIVFILVIQVAQILAPSVDVEIGDSSADDAMNAQKEEEMEKMIDERLKWIQFEDNNATTPEAEQTAQDAEKLLEEGNKGNTDVTAKEIKAPEVQPHDIMKDSIKPHTPKPEAGQTLNKVLIGTYATVEQAIEAQNNIVDLNLGITSSIKDMGGSFTLQAGAFTNRAKAEELASKLSEHGIACRIVQE